MKCLLDTHAFIWLITEDPKLSSNNCLATTKIRLTECWWRRLSLKNFPS